ncbi:MAG TPA: hypothetical protein VNA30_02180 [Mycobacteriales bacterium]|nr:hypothetical protein [Mycobacteriales bacterium]
MATLPWGERVDMARRAGPWATGCLALTLLGCTPGQERARDRESDGVDRLAQPSPGPEVSLRLPDTVGRNLDLDTLAPFPWSHVYVFGPYRDSTHISKVLGFAWNTRAVQTLSRSDSVCLFVFLSFGTPLKEALVPRKPDCAPLDAASGYERYVKTRFAVRPGQGEGETVLSKELYQRRHPAPHGGSGIEDASPGAHPRAGDPALLLPGRRPREAHASPEGWDGMSLPIGRRARIRGYLGDPGGHARDGANLHPG